jgi:Acyl-CoA dehydrogenases
MSLNPLVDSRDVRFVVFEMLEIDKINRYERFTELDRDMYEDTLNLAEKIAVDQFLTSNADGDKIGLKFNSDNHEVKVPESFHKGFKAYIEAGFHNLAFPPEEGGMGMPVTIAFASQEYFNAGNTSLGMYCSTLTGTAHLLMAYGSEEVKKMFLHKMITGEWCGTMCLHRTGRRLRCRGSQDESRKTERRHLPHYRTEDIHQQRRTRFNPQHHPSGTGQNRGRS